MMNKNILLGRLKNYNGFNNMIVKDQQVADIISAMLSCHQIYKSEYDKISKDFFSNNGVQTSKKIFDFLKKNIQYKIEPDTKQRVMSPSAILSIGKNDCKNYALFILGILDSLKRKGLINNKIFYRFASYKILDETPHHVFAVIIDDNGNEVFIDPVLQTFNEKKTYFHKIDKLNNMPLYSVSGTHTSKNKISGPMPVVKEKKKIVLNIALAPARGAFLLLVGLNFMGLASKIKKAFDNRADATQNFWKNLGGNPNELLRKVNQGAAKKRILGTDVEFLSEGQVGVIATGTAAASVTAAPILIKVAEFLAKLGIDVKEVAEVGKRVLSSQVKNILEKKLENDAKIERASNEEVNRIVNNSKDRTTNYVPYLIGAGAVIYLATKK